MPTATETETGTAVIGVVIVSFNAQDYIAPCLESLFASGYPGLRVVVVDNASQDEAVGAIRSWADGSRPFVAEPDSPLPPGPAITKPVALDERTRPDGMRPITAPLTLIHAGENLGFAGGVNIGLERLLATGDVEYLWVLNPDTLVAPETPRALADAAARMGRFSVIGGRTMYFSPADRIYSDGGQLHPIASTPISININRTEAESAMPAAADLDYIHGVSMFVSRAFCERAGLMDERWFLYYEEIDWQFRRGDLPLGLCPQARIYHRVGAAIGTGGFNRMASPFSAYFNFRNLLPFVRRWRPLRLPLTYAMAYAKIMRHFRSAPDQRAAALRGLHGMGPPPGVRQRLAAPIWAKILGAKFSSVQAPRNKEMNNG